MCFSSYHCLIQGEDVCCKNFAHESSYADGRVANVNGVVRLWGLDIEFQNVMDVECINVQGAQTLHHPRLTAQQLKHTTGNNGQKSAWSGGFRKLSGVACIR